MLFQLYWLSGLSYRYIKAQIAGIKTQIVGPNSSVFKAKTLDLIPNKLPQVKSHINYWTIFPI